MEESSWNWVIISYQSQEQQHNFCLVSQIWFTNPLLHPVYPVFLFSSLVPNSTSQNSYITVPQMHMEPQHQHKHTQDTEGAAEAKNKEMTRWRRSHHLKRKTEMHFRIRGGVRHTHTFKKHGGDTNRFWDCFLLPRSRGQIQEPFTTQRETLWNTLWNLLLLSLEAHLVPTESVSDVHLQIFLSKTKRESSKTTSRLHHLLFLTLMSQQVGWILEWSRQNSLIFVSRDQIKTNKKC